MKKILILMLLGFLIPQVTLAAWWNPFTWSKNKREDSRTKILEDRIKDLEKKIEQMNISTTTLIQASTTIQVVSPKVDPKPVVNKSSVNPQSKSQEFKDYEKLYLDLSLSYSELRQIVFDEIYRFREVKIKWDAERDYSALIAKYGKAVSADIETLEGYKKVYPKPSAIIEGYILRQKNTRAEFLKIKQDLPLKIDTEREAKNRSEMRSDIIAFIKENRLNLYKESFHVAAASLLDEYDRTFGTKYYDEFKVTKTQTETIEFADHFLAEVE